jgi:RES domain-containing protein
MSGPIPTGASVPGRWFSGRFWHQGPTRHPLGSFADPAVTDGRYHCHGGAGAWYASDREQTAWAELFRHFTTDGVDPFEVRRRVGAADVEGLWLLDLTDTKARRLLGIEEEDLLGDDYGKCQAVADFARVNGFEGLLAPSAAVAGGKTLVVFASGMSKLTLGRSRVRQPPPRIADLLRAIRLRDDAPAAVRSYLKAVAAAGSDVVRAARRPRSKPGG